MTKSVAVVGAGISGLIFARELSKYTDIKIQIFEKANRPGGRSCSREIRSNVFIDLGAQFFTIRTLFMESLLEPYFQTGLVMKWSPKLWSWNSNNSSMHFKNDEIDRYVATPSMGHLALALSDKLSINYRTEIRNIGIGANKKWSLIDTHNQILGEFDFVVFTMPPPQAERLLRTLPTIEHEFQRMSPCIAVGLEFETEKDLLPNCEAIQFEDHPIFSWIVKDTSKPLRDKSSQRWVLHASAKWSEEHIDFDVGESSLHLIECFETLILKHKLDRSFLNILPHRWRYAKPQQVDKRKYRFYEDLGLGFCGDSFAGPRFEGAVLSGAALAHEFSRFFDMNKKIEH